MLHQLNQQEPMRVDRRKDGHIIVHSMFRTIQGEGPFAGHPALFIRLMGCNLQCPHCDTEYTARANEIDSNLLGKYVQVWHDWQAPGLIVITGGEPFRQNITPAVQHLLKLGYRVQIESNGVLYPGDDFPWSTYEHTDGGEYFPTALPHATVVVSPKTAKIHPKTAMRADAYKYVLAHDGVAPDGLPEMALGHPLAGASHVARPPKGWTGPVYVNPMDAKDEAENKRNLRAVVDTVMANPGYIMGVQMHKLTGLP